MNTLMIVKNRNSGSLLLLIALLLLQGCGKEETGSKRAAELYHLKGQVVALDPGASLITVAHEKIPNFMEAMTMPFSVKDTAVFRVIEVGDSIRGVVVLQRPELWLDSIVVVWKMPTSELSR